MKKYRKKTGLPGSVVFVGNQKVEKVIIHYLQYDEAGLTDKTYDNHSEFAFLPSPEEKVDWYDVRGFD